MTRQRLYGDDNVWGAWVRALGCAGGPLPSSGLNRGTTINDWDMILHQYKTPVDRQGTRDVHCMMCVECKTRLAGVSPTQSETLWLHHQSIRQKYQALTIGRTRKIAVWHFGVSVLRCDGEDPAYAQRFDWGRFTPSGDIVYRAVTLDTVIELLQFNLDPDTLARTSFRRHHKVSQISRQVLTPLGFAVEEQQIKRS